MSIATHHGPHRADSRYPAHQVALSVAGWREFVLFAPRTDLLSANKEGIVSLFGYLALHLLGLSTGTMILPPSPSYFRRQQLETLKVRSRRDSNAGLTETSGTNIRREDDKTATELAAYAILWWTFLGLSSFLDSVAGVSRRLVSLVIRPSSGYSTPRIGQSTLHSMGGCVQYFFHPCIFPVGSLLLPITAVQINLFSDIQAKGTEGEVETPDRSSDRAREGCTGFIAGDQSKRTFGVPACEWVRDFGWVVN